MTHADHHLFTEAVVVAEQLGYRVVVDWLDGCGGSVCRASGRQWILLDRGLTLLERLRQLLAILRADNRIAAVTLSSELSAAFGHSSRAKAA
jgi:hypothetical protein